MTDVSGVIAAAITPRGKQGDVDFGATFELVDYLCAAGVRGIALFSATGEYPALSFDERSRLIYLAVKRSRVPLLVGVGSATLDVSVALAREARRAGVAGLLLPPPYFFRYQQDDIREFYLQFAAQVGADAGAAIFLCNIPSFASEIAVESALHLLHTGLFAGIENAGGDLEYFARLKPAADARPFTLLVANDAIFTRARSAGGCSGTISPAACAVPELMLALDRAIVSGDQAAAARLDELLQEFLAWIDRFPQPAAIKAAVGQRGLKTGPLTVPLSPEKRRKLDEFREWFQGWLPAMKESLVTSV
jgi:4-hydroxy-tetrahydrodipicolinate synthase